MMSGWASDRSRASALSARMCALKRSGRPSLTMLLCSSVWGVEVCADKAVLEMQQQKNVHAPRMIGRVVWLKSIDVPRADITDERVEARIARCVRVPPEGVQRGEFGLGPDFDHDIRRLREEACVLCPQPIGDDRIDAHIIARERAPELRLFDVTRGCRCLHAIGATAPGEQILIDRAPVPALVRELADPIRVPVARCQVFAQRAHRGLAQPLHPDCLGCPCHRLRW